MIAAAQAVPLTPVNPSLPMEFFIQRHAGDVASRVAANEQVARLLL